VTRPAPRRSRTFVFERGTNRQDAQYAHLEQLAGCNVAISVATVFAHDVGEEVVRRTLLQAVTEVRRFRDQLRRMPVGLAAPLWTDAPEFCVDDHIATTVLPPLAGWDDVMAVVDRRHSHPFREDRPPWSVEYVRGAPEGRCLVMMQLHHALSDGSGLAAMLSAIFVRRLALGAPVAIESAGEQRRERMPTALLRQWRAQAHDWRLVASTHAPRLARSADRRRIERVALAEYAGKPRWGGTRSPERRTTLFQISRSAWEAAARARRGNVNDLYLALAAASMRQQLAGTAAGVHRPIRLVMPVNVRGRSERQDGGNVTGAGVLHLSGVMAELDDLDAVRSAARRVLREQLASETTLVDATVALLPGPLQARCLLRRFAKTDVMATSITVPVACEFEGHPAEMMFVIPSVIGALAAFGLGRYAGGIHLAVTLDAGLVPDPLRLPSIVETLLTHVVGREQVTRLGPARSRLAAVPA
jgi:hypothetical protein